MTKLDGICGVATLVSSLRRSCDRLVLRKLRFLHLPSVFANFISALSFFYSLRSWGSLVIYSLRSWDSLRSFIRYAHLLTALVGVVLVGCDRGEMTNIRGKTMGTTYSVKVFSDKKIDKAQLKKEIDEVLVKLNLEMSTYIPESEISYFNKFDRLGEMKVSADFFYVAKYSLSLAHQTNGVYDPTIGPLVNLWGFGPDGKREVPSSSDIKRAKSLVGYQHISLNEKNKTLSKKIPGVYLDLSSSAKGFGVDKIASLLVSKELTNYMVEIGGEIKASGHKEGKKNWRVAIEVPAKTSAEKRSEQKVIELNDMAIATSGSYRNYFLKKDKAYSHTINYETGKPVEHHMVSVSVLSQSCMKADALATALMVMGPEKAKAYVKKENIAAFLIIKDKDADKLMTYASPLFMGLEERL